MANPPLTTLFQSVSQALVKAAQEASRAAPDTSPHCITTETDMFAAADDMLAWAVGQKTSDESIER